MRILPQDRAKRRMLYRQVTLCIFGLTYSSIAYKNGRSIEDIYGTVCAMAMVLGIDLSKYFQSTSSGQ